MSDQEYFCAAAWTGLYLHPDGGVDFCCVAKNNLGNIKENSLQEIMSSARVREIRQSMLNDQPVAGCSACWRQDKEHRMQTFFNTKYVRQQPIGRVQTCDPVLDQQFFSSVDNSRPKYLDLRWNNTCNFACMYCGEEYSSLWAEENQKHNLSIIVEKPDRVEKQSIFDYLNQAYQSVDWIYFAGGEPLAIKENASMLDSLHAINPDCVLQINTNLSMLDGNPIFDRLKKFTNVRWMISGEAMGDIFEYMRWPGRWENFQNNIRTVSKLRNLGHEITFNLVAMNINHLTIWDYVDFLLDLDIVDKPSDINLNLYDMRESSNPFSIQRMPLMWKDQVRELLNRRQYTIRGVDNYLDALEDALPKNQIKWHGLEYTVSRLAMLDRQRQVDSRRIFPHVYDYIAAHPQ